MGWNDHIIVEEVECLDCGLEDEWSFWDSIGEARDYAGHADLLGAAVTQIGRCPHCGSTNHGNRVEHGPYEGLMWDETNE